MDSLRTDTKIGKAEPEISPSLFSGDAKVFQPHFPHMQQYSPRPVKAL